MSTDPNQSSPSFLRRLRLDNTQPLPGPWRQAIQVLLIALCSIGLYLLTRESLGELPARTLAIFLFAAVCWATEVIPLFATSFLVVAAEILLLATQGGLAREFTALAHQLGLPPVPNSTTETLKPMAAGAFLSPFSNDIMFLFMGGFLLSAAVTRHGLDQVLARLILKPFSHSPFGLLAAILGIGGFLSAWMSNTATTAMLIAIVRPLLRGLHGQDRYRAGLVLAVPIGANLGGIATPIGTPPNAVAFGAINASGIDLSFLEWMMVAVPLAVLLLGVALAILWFFHRPTPEFVMPTDAFGDTTQPQPVSLMGWVTLGVLALAVAGWLTGDLTGIAPGVVALIAAALLTTTRTLNQKDVDSIDWNVLILIWGGLSLSVAMDGSGLTKMLSSVDLSQTPGGPIVLGIGMSLTALLMSTFMSNTATAGLLVPMALALSVTDKAELAMLAAISCSFAMALPVSTPPNAIAFATGSVSLGSMVKTGGLVGLASVMIMLAGYKVMLPPILEKARAKTYSPAKPSSEPLPHTDSSPTK